MQTEILNKALDELANMTLTEMMQLDQRYQNEGGAL